MITLTYAGLIRLGDYGESTDSLYVGDSDLPLSMILEDEIVDRQVSVRYYISDEPKSKEELLENQILTLAGVADADYGQSWSDITGYLWTTERLMIGGHDLMDELTDNQGKYIWLEIDVHD